MTGDPWAVRIAIGALGFVAVVLAAFGGWAIANGHDGTALVGAVTTLAGLLVPSPLSKLPMSLTLRRPPPATAGRTGAKKP